MSLARLATSTGALHLLGDPTRVRLLALLQDHELSVAELTRITELAQSRVSTHLGKLRDAGLVHDRRQGTSMFYRAHAAMPEPAASVWELLRGRLSDPLLERDATRLVALLAARLDPQRWPESVAGEMERHYSPGRTWESLAHGLAGLLTLGDVLDIGCGDGWTATLLVDRCRSYVGLDRSAAVVEAARRRLSSHQHVRFECGEMEALNFSQRFDAVLLLHVLTYAGSPQCALEKAAALLNPGGAIVVTTLASHDHLEATSAYGHRHAGFPVPDLEKWLEAAGLRVEQCELTSRERRAPHYEVITAVARRPRKTAPLSDKKN